MQGAKKGEQLIAITFKTGSTVSPGFTALVPRGRGFCSRRQEARTRGEDLNAERGFKDARDERKQEGRRSRGL